MDYTNLFNEAKLFVQSGELSQRSDEQLRMYLRACTAFALGEAAWSTMLREAIQAELDARQAKRHAAEVLASHDELKGQIAEVKKAVDELDRPKWMRKWGFWIAIIAAGAALIAAVASLLALRH